MKTQLHALPNPEISIVIVNWNVKDYLRQCIQSIDAAADTLSSETIVVDNASSDGSVEMLMQEFPEVTVIASKENLGFGRGNNVGIQRARGDYVALVNPDVVLLPGSMQEMVTFLGQHPTVGMVGPKVLAPDGKQTRSTKDRISPKHALFEIPGISKVAKRFRKTKIHASRCFSLQGCCMVFPRDALCRIGGLPVQTFMYGEEQILGERLRKLGLEVWFYPTAEIIHFDGASQKKRWAPANTEFLVLKRVAAINTAREILSPGSFVVWNAITAFDYAARYAVSIFQERSLNSFRWTLLKLHLDAFSRPSERI